MLETVALKVMIEPLVLTLSKTVVDILKEHLRSDDPSKITNALAKASETDTTEELMKDINEILRVSI
jgi:hypothetical protein